MVWHKERRVRYQDLPFGECMRKTGTYYKTKAYRNAIMKQLYACYATWNKHWIVLLENENCSYGFVS